MDEPSEEDEKVQSPSAPWLAREESPLKGVGGQILNATPRQQNRSGTLLDSSDIEVGVDIDSTDESRIDIDPSAISVDSSSSEDLASDLRAWRQNAQSLSREVKLEELKGRFSPEDLARQLLALLGFPQPGSELRAAQPNAQPFSPDGDAPELELQKAVYALLAVEISERGNQAIPLLIASAVDSGTVADDAIGDLLQVFNVILVAQACALTPMQAEELPELLSVPLSSVQDALARLLNLSELTLKHREFAEKLWNQMDYGDHTAPVQKPTPMSTEELVKAAASIFFNGPREGLFSQYLVQVVVQGICLAAVPTLSLTGQCLVSGATLSLTQAFAYFRVKSQESAAYRAHPMQSFTVLQGLSVGVPLGMCATTLFAACLGAPPQVIDVLLSGQNSLARKRFANVFRELAQTYTRSHLTAGFDLVHADGSGLTASEQEWVNLVRDLLYVITSVLLLFGGQTLAKEWLAQAAASVTDTSSAFRAAALLNIFTGLNDMCEGWSMDMARVICRLLWGDEYILQPGTQRNPGTDPTHWLNHMVSRLTTGPIIDFLLWVAEALEKFGVSPHAVRSVQFLWAVVNGLLGGLRGRVISMVNSEDLVDNEGKSERGTREPGGLMSWGFKTARSGVNTAWDAFGAYADAWAAFNAGHA